MCGFDFGIGFFPLAFDHWPWILGAKNAISALICKYDIVVKKIRDLCVCFPAPNLTAVVCLQTAVLYDEWSSHRGHRMSSQAHRSAEDAQNFISGLLACDAPYGDLFPL